MSPTAPVSISAFMDLQNDPPAGPFFQDYYAEPAHAQAAGSSRLPFLLDFSAKTRERVLTQAAAHWQSPTLTHYAAHELELLEYRLPALSIALQHRYETGGEPVLWAVKQILATALKAAARSDRSLSDDGLDLSGITHVPPDLLQSLAQPLLANLCHQTSPDEQRRSNCAATAWLAAVPQLLRTLLYATPQAVEASAQRDLIETLRRLPVKLLTEVLPEAAAYGEVYYPWPASTGETAWHTVNGVVCSYNELIIIDIDFDADSALARTEEFGRYLAMLEGSLQRTAPCAHFRRYLESAPEVSLYQNEGSARYTERMRLRRTQFKHITHLAVSLDDMLAQVQRLQPLLRQPDSYPVLPVSLHELMCYRDLQDNPAVFMHFLKQRSHALANPHLGRVAELDHIGMHHGQMSYADDLDVLTNVRTIVQHRYHDHFWHFFQRSLHGRLPGVKESTSTVQRTL